MTPVSRRLTVGVAALLPVGMARAQPRSENPAGVLLNPSGQDVIFLYYALRDTPPPLAEWRRSDSAVARADEFHKAEAEAAFDRRIMQGIAAFRTVRSIRFNLNATISTYAADEHAYYLGGLASGVTVPFDYLQTRVALRAVNGDHWTTWSPKPADAERVLRKNQNARQVLLVYQSSLVADGARYPAQGEIPVEIEAIDVLGADRQTLLGRIRP